MLNRNLETGHARRPELRRPAKPVARCNIAARLAATHYEVPVAIRSGRPARATSPSISRMSRSA